MKTDVDLVGGACERKIGNRKLAIDRRRDRVADEGKRDYFRVLNSGTNQDEENETIIMLPNR